jgi:hypothetical protein
MGNISEPEEMNNNCGKLMYMGTMDRGLLVFSCVVRKISVWFNS